MINKQEFIVTNQLHPQCLMLEPWEVFSKSIETVIDHKRIVYDYCAMIAALAESYKQSAQKLEGEPEPKDEDFLDQAVEWVEYNTMRSLPYYAEEFRPYVVYIPKETLDEYIEVFRKAHGSKIDTIIQQPIFIQKCTNLRQECYGDVDNFEKRFTRLMNSSIKNFEKSLTSES